MTVGESCHDPIWQCRMYFAKGYCQRNRVGRKTMSVCGEKSTLIVNDFTPIAVIAKLFIGRSPPSHSHILVCLVC